MLNNWKDTNTLPPIGVEVEVSYTAPINGLKYMGIATYIGNGIWLLNNEKVSTKIIICWQPKTLYYEG